MEAAMEEGNPPAELQVGWLLDRYGIAVLGPDFDVKFVIRATRLVSIHRAFSKLCMEGGQKHVTRDEWKVIRDTTVLKKELEVKRG